ncbi:MAG: carbon monoxide dehydrogenase subunit G [Rhodomicrobium sp.]
MEMTGEQRIPANREVVWKALNDPRVLEACIPGCQELIKSSDNEMTAITLLKVGPVTARFQGAVTLSDVDPPNSYRITGEGQGGVAGFAKGTAAVRLEEDGAHTILHYTVSAQVGGKLSQLGGRLIDATAKQMSSAFFKRFAEEIGSQHAGPAGSGATAAQLKLEDVSGSQAQPDRRYQRPRSAPLDLTPGIFKHWKWAAIILLAAVAGLAWNMLGGTLPIPVGSQEHVSPEFASAVQLIIVAAIGYLFGRQHSKSGSSRAIIVDLELLNELARTRFGRNE